MSKSNVRYFIRDDDIGPLTEALENFATLFAERRIPVSYQIIPEKLTAECANFLRSMVKAHPGLLEFGQHGLRHEMDKGGKPLKREFGPERTYAEQADDIAKGLAILKSHLSDEIRVFTPPQHKYDINTVRAAFAAGHKVFSSAAYCTIRHQSAYWIGRKLRLSSIRHHGISYHGGLRPEAGLFELSVAIALDDGRRFRTPASALARKLAHASKRCGQVGLMFHHELYGSRAGHLQLLSIADALAAYGVENFRRLGDLACGPQKN